MEDQREELRRDALRRILRERYDFPAGESDLVTGATVIQRSVFPNCTQILFCEDGFLDGDGQPWIMQARLAHGAPEGERILALYRPDGRRYLFPAEDEALALIGPQPPEAVRKLDYYRAKRIVHRRTLGLRGQPQRVPREELRERKRSYAGTYKKGRLLCAGLLLTVSLFLIFLLAFSVLFSDKLSAYKESTAVAILAGFAAGWLLCSAAVVILVVKAPLLRLRKYGWKSECLVDAVCVRAPNGSMKRGADVDLIVCSGGAWKLCSAFVPYYDEALLRDVRPYDTVIRYAGSPDPRDDEPCLLIKKQ